MFSQNEEEKYIVDYFKGTTGRFIDIGAYDVFRFSNTRALYERGWSGVLVEPSPSNYKAIADHYKDEPGIEVLNVAVGLTSGMIDFYESDGDAVSTSDIDHMNKWGNAGVKYTKIQVGQTSVTEFMDRYFKNADFLSIDTEATNLELFNNIPEYVFQMVKMICIEHDGRYPEVSERLQPFGFKTIYLNAENIILAK